MFLFISPFDDIKFYHNHFRTDLNLIYMPNNVKNIDASSSSSHSSSSHSYFSASLEYANYLLSKNRNNIKKAINIINTVISFQNKNTSLDTYGSFSPESQILKLKETNPLVIETLYICINLLQMLKQYPDLISEEMKEIIRATCHNSSTFIIKNMISYTPHSISKLLEVYFFIMYSDIFQSMQFFNHAVSVLNNYYSGIYYNGFFWEYGAFYETYILSEILYELKINHSHPECLEMTDYLYDYLWEYISNNFHGGFSKLTGPQSEIHKIFTSADFSAFLEFTLDVSNNEQHTLTPIISKCPDKYKFHFKKKEPKNFILKCISKDSFDSAKPNIAANYIRPHYTIGSFNSTSFWYSYNPIQGYFKSSGNVPYKFGLTVINEDHSFSSAGLNCIQYKNNILGHISFFNNHGDRHYSLTPIDGKIYTTNFRIRFFVAGFTKNLKITRSKNMIIIKNEYITLNFDFSFIKVDDFQIQYEILKEKNILYFDAVIIKNDTPVELDFLKISTAICQFTIHITSSDEPANKCDYTFDEQYFIGTMETGENVLKLKTIFSPTYYEYAIKNKHQYINEIRLIDHINTTTFLTAQNNYSSSKEEYLSSYIINKHSDIYTSINKIDEIPTDELISYILSVMNKTKQENLSVILLKGIFSEIINKIFDCIVKKDFTMQKYIDRNFFNIYQNINSAFSFDEICNIVISCTEKLIHTLDNYKKDITNISFTKIISIIDTEYSNSALSLSYISEKTGINETHINRLFKKNMNTTYKKYLTKIRLEHAKELLASKKYTLDEIISLSGYNCYSTFKQAFKEYTNMSISAWINGNIQNSNYDNSISIL